ncbi:MAG: zinc ribbon domain-containing protein [Gemmatimonadales bacterium]
MGGTACPNCASPLSAGARFCHICGAPLGAKPIGGRGNNLPWLVAGVSIALLLVVAVIKYDGGGSAQDGGLLPQPTQLLQSSSGITDISQMSPRERANRLFDRVVAAAERGDSSEVAFFSPMAIQSYELLGTWDDDARYDVGIIYAVSAQLDDALAQADSIELSNPNHLLAKVIRAEVANRRNDREAQHDAYRDFLSAYDVEIEILRPEYAAHRRTIDGFRSEAQQSVQGSNGS